MSKLTIQLKLTIGAVFAVMIMLVINGIIGFQQTKSLLVENAHNDINTAGQSLVLSIDAWQSSKLSILGSAAELSESDHVEDVMLQGAKAGNFLYMYLGSSKGEMIMRPYEELPDGYDPRTRPWYKDAIAAGKPILTAPYVDAAW